MKPPSMESFECRRRALFCFIHKHVIPEGLKACPGMFLSRGESGFFETEKTNHIPDRSTRG